MGYIKQNFENLINRHGHKVLIKHTNKKQSCPRSLDEDHDTNCPQCYGLDYKYNYYIAEVRKTDGGIQPGEKDSSNPINFSDEGRTYYFKSEYPINEDDFIIEYKNNQLSLFLITNIEPQYGDTGELAFNSVVVREVSINKDVIKTDLLRFKNE